MALRVDLGGTGRGGLWTTVNNDASGLRPLADLVADIRECAHELEQYFDPQSVDEMRCCHTLEHLPFMEIIPNLRYWATFLKPNALILVVVPDMGEIVRQYADGEIPFDVVAALVYGDTPGYRRDRSEVELHKWGFDMYTLEDGLREAGYHGIQLAGDERWPASWLFDYPAYAYTGLVGKWSVPNLRMIGVAP